MLKKRFRPMAVLLIFMSLLLVLACGNANNNDPESPENAGKWIMVTWNTPALEKCLKV